MVHPYDQTPRLVGREPQLSTLRDLVRTATVDGSPLLLTGEPGVGKSALLDGAADMAAAAGVRVVRGEGVEYETDVSFAGLHQLVDPLAGELQQLPSAGREALQVALGIGSGPVPDRLAVMGAALALFRLVASSSPLLVVIDDMQWLDRATASVIGFVGRRLAGSPVGLLGATRTGSGGFFERTGWSELVVPPLDEADAMELLAHQFAHLPVRVHREIVDGAQGNPLALLEFAAAAAGPRQGGLWYAGASTGTSREVRGLYESRIGRLPAATRHLLLAAVLDGSGSLAVVAAVSRSGGLEDLGPAERDHLVVIDSSVGEMRFRHPLIKSVLVENSTVEDRRIAHRQLAEVFVDQPERRGYHVAEAALGPDEDVAVAVEAGARRTLQRGDVAGAVTRLLRAADLSPHRAGRSRRLAEAAFIGAFSAGRLESSPQLLREATDGDPTSGETLHAAVATAYFLLNSDGDAAVAYRLLTVALDSALAQPERDVDGLSRALYTLVVLCHYAANPDYWVTFHDAVARLGAEDATDAMLLAETLADPARAAPWALSELDRVVGQLSDTLDVGHVVRTAIAAFYTDRLAGCRDALDRVVREGQEGGAIGSALMALQMITFDDLGAGRWAAAERAAAEAAARCEELGYQLYGWSSTYALALVAAYRGDQEACTASCQAMMAWTAPRQLGIFAGFAHHALAEAALGQADFETSYAHGSAVSSPGSLGSHNPQALWSALGLVDAALHTGRSDEARAHAEAMRDADLARLSPRFALSTDAALAMVAPDAEAPQLFDEALALVGVAEWPFELARVQLAYGERLRRLRRTRDARNQLRAAQSGFDRLGAASWSRRASTELRATGATRTAGGAELLTPQEVEVAELAAGGLTNREIATRLYVSPRTVSAHLYRAFPKLGITTRAALRDALNATSGDTAV